MAPKSGDVQCNITYTKTHRVHSVASRLRTTTVREALSVLFNKCGDPHLID